MAERAGSGGRFVPAQHQPPLPVDRLILTEGAEGAGDRMDLDVLIVGDLFEVVPKLTEEIKKLHG